jgi:hypothetical protein
LKSWTELEGKQFIFNISRCENTAVVILPDVNKGRKKIGKRKELRNK